MIKRGSKKLGEKKKKAAWRTFGDKMSGERIRVRKK